MTFLNSCFLLVMSVLFVNGFDPRQDSSNGLRLHQPPPVFWRWSQTGQPQTEQPQIVKSQTGSHGLSEQVRSSVVTMELVEQKGDSYSAWMSLYDPHHINKNPISHGSNQRDNPPVWIGDLNNPVEERIRPTEEILLIGKRTKLSYKPRRKKILKNELNKLNLPNFLLFCSKQSLFTLSKTLIS
jgi:hypothetical protein